MRPPPRQIPTVALKPPTQPTGKILLFQRQVVHGHPLRLLANAGFGQQGRERNDHGIGHHRMRRTPRRGPRWAAGGRAPGTPSENHWRSPPAGGSPANRSPDPRRGGTKAPGNATGGPSHTRGHSARARASNPNALGDAVGRHGEAEDESNQGDFHTADLPRPMKAKPGRKASGRVIRRAAERIPV